MTVVTGVALVKDEESIIGYTAEHMLHEVDNLIIANNLSTDRTAEILEDLAARHPGRVEIRVDDNPAHVQSEKTTRLALESGADWVVPFDADEWWYSPFGTIKDVLSGLGEQWLAADAALYDHVPTALDDPSEMDPTIRIGWRRIESLSIPKVACRVRDDMVIGEGNHNVSYRGGTTSFPDHLVVRHYPYRSVDQFVAKVKKGYKSLLLADLPSGVGAHWRAYGELMEAHGEGVLAEVFEEHFWSEDPENNDGLIFDPAPRP